MSTPMHPGWRVQLAVHRAVRRDLTRLSLLLASAPRHKGDALLDYWDVTSDQLHEHHTLEDTLIWPLLRSRLGTWVDDLLDRNLDEHRQLTAAMGRFESVVTSGSHEDSHLESALAQLRSAADTHLTHEEAEVLPLIQEAFTLEDVAMFSTAAAKTNPPANFLPWLLDDAPDEDVQFFTTLLPAPVSAQLHSMWTPLWQAKVRALRALAPVTAGR